MNALNTSMALAASGMQAQATRLRLTSENIANADTPGFHRKTVMFRDAVEGDRVTLGPVRLDPTAPDRIYDPAHPLADATGHYRGSNVDLLVEIADAREAQRSYEANLKMFDQARQMSSGLMELLRR
ncbi:flagellar basal body rod protein FlgC [Rhodovulum sp. YNF3179]|uniref:flagellar basal body rod protein FlgC n=1 Tax=Rhodovulum sp. YNF3179 TaxID=3425127 RepID=UPI003D3398FC